MDLTFFSEILTTYYPVFFVALAITFAGNLWITYLYPKALLRDSLSFPKHIEERAKHRNQLLFLSLLLFIAKAWIQIAMPTLLYTIIAISVLMFITVTDFEQHVILNEMLLVFALCGLCYTFHLQFSLQDHLLAAIGGGLLFLFLSFISKGAIGGGDIKLIATLGLWLGWKSLLSVILYGAMAGGVAAFILLLTKRIKRNQFLAYGPYFTLSAIGLMLKLLRVLF